MQIKIKMLSGKIMMMNFEDKQTVADVKNTIQEVEGIHPDQIKLIYQGKILENEKTIQESGLNPNNQIHMVLNLRGG